MCAHACAGTYRDQKAVGSPGARVRDDWKPLTWVLGTQVLWREQQVLRHPTCPVEKISVLRRSEEREPSEVLQSCIQLLGG